LISPMAGFMSPRLSCSAKTGKRGYGNSTPSPWLVFRPACRALGSDTDPAGFACRPGTPETKGSRSDATRPAFFSEFNFRHLHTGVFFFNLVDRLILPPLFCSDGFTLRLLIAGFLARLVQVRFFLARVPCVRFWPQCLHRVFFFF